MSDIFLYSYVAPTQAAFSGTLVTVMCTLISGAIIVLLTQHITYLYQGMNKQRETSGLAKTMLQYINIVLCLEYGQLAGIKKILDFYAPEKSKRKKVQKFIFIPLITQVKDEYIQKLLACAEFGKSKEGPAVIQGIVYAETLYQKCLNIIEQYLNILDDERMSKADEKTRLIFINSAASLLDVLRLAQKEAFQVNENARNKILPLGKELFGESFILPKVDDEVILVTTL